MINHRKVQAAAASVVLAAALFSVTPSYGFWFLFGYPHHTNSAGHYDSCCNPDYGYVYHHENTHDEPYFREETGGEHHAAHHGEGRRAEKRSHARPASFRCEDCDGHSVRRAHPRNSRHAHR